MRSMKPHAPKCAMSTRSEAAGCTFLMHTDRTVKLQTHGRRWRFTVERAWLNGPEKPGAVQLMRAAWQQNTTACCCMLLLHCR